MRLAQLQNEVEGLYWTVKRIKGHKCNLVEEVDSVAKFIKAGWFVPLRRKIKTFLLVSENNPFTKSHLKSTARIRIENMRHLDKYYYMVHPFSDGRLYWEIIMGFVYNIQLIMVPILIMASKDLRIGPEYAIPFLMLLNTLCGLDIIATFFSGYFIETEQKIVLNWKIVAKKYICSYFFFDLLSVFQLNYIGYWTGLFRPNAYYNIQWLFRIPRIGTTLKTSNMYGGRWNVPRYVVRTAVYINIWIIVFIDIIYLIVVNRILDMGITFDFSNRSILLVVCETLQTIFLLRVPESMAQQTWSAMAIYLGLLFVGLFMQMFIAAQILQIFICRNISQNKYTHLVNQIKAYTTFKQVPQQVNNRIKSYVHFKFQKTVFKEKVILESLSHSLRNEIIWHLCENFISRLDIFKDMPTDVMMKLVQLLKQEIYLPNDVVVQTGDLGSEMFFIYVGVLAVYTATGKEICHLTDGDHFGEIALFLNETRVASCVAVDFCELYRLTKRDFNKSLEAYPEAKQTIIQHGRERFRETKQLNLLSATL